MSTPPIYIVTGDDSYLVDAEVHRLVHELAGDAEVALSVEDFRPDQLTDAIDACRTPPFLSDRRVVVVREAASMGADGVALVSGYLAEPLDTSVLVVAWGPGRVPAALTTAIRSSGGQPVDTSVPSGAKGRSGWVEDRISEKGLRLDARARELLIRHLGQDVDRIDGLLASLEAAYGPKARMGESEVEPFLGSAGDVPPWDLTDAIDRGDTAGALRFLARMSGGGRQSLAVMAILQRHYSGMLSVDGIRSDAEAADALGFSGGSAAFRAGKLRGQASRLGTGRIARAITLLSDADLDLRGRTGWPPELVMEVLVARLSRLIPHRTAARR